MPRTTGTDVRADIAAVLPGRWRGGAERAWSYAVYCVGYRLLSAHVACGSLVVSGAPFVIKCA